MFLLLMNLMSTVTLIINTDKKYITLKINLYYQYIRRLIYI